MSKAATQTAAEQGDSFTVSATPGRYQRVLLDESVYEDATVTVTPTGQLWIEFHSGDLGSVMLDLLDLEGGPPGPLRRAYDEAVPAVTLPPIPMPNGTPTCIACGQLGGHGGLSCPRLTVWCS